jgi:integrase
MDKSTHKVTFRLERRRSNPKDNTSAVLTENVPIIADITFNCRRIFYFTGHRIDEVKWNAEQQKVKRNNFNAKGESATDINGRLDKIRVAVDVVFARMSVNGIPFTAANVRDELKAELCEEKEVQRKVAEYYNQFIEEESKNGTWAKGTIAKHRTVLSHLNGFKRGIYFEDITTDFLNRFVQYLLTKSPSRYNKETLSNTTVTKLIRIFKWFMNWATQKKYNKVLDYKDFSPKLKGVSSTDKTNIIALSMPEFMRLYNMDIEKTYLRRVRDVFCFCCATSLRYSDVRNLKWSNIQGDSLEIVTIKTNDPLVIPLNEFAKEIIARYRENEVITEYVLPVISNQKYNDYIKELGKLAGFDQPITKVYYRDSEREEVTLPKYELLTSHVARKTFVTIALYLGIPAEIVRTFTGHKDAKVMERYFKFNAEQQRQMMQKFNVKHDEVETVFDYKITDEERERLNISEKQSYNNSIKGNPALLQLHVALLMNIRGEVVKSLEMASRLPDSMKLDYMNAIKTGL